MKVTREQSKFKPVTIVLETQQEVDFLHGLLNIGPYALKGDAEYYDRDLDYKMWEALDDVINN